MLLRVSVFALAVLSPLSALAQAEPPPAAPAGAPPAAPAEATPVVAAPAPAPAPAAAPAPTWKDMVTLEGLVDSYYMYNFSGANSLTSPAGRQFDTNSNTFTLNYAKVGIGMTSDKVGLRMDLGYGATGAIVNSGSSTAMTAGTAFLVQQAYATLTPVTNLTIDFGKFVTTAGSEVIESNKNWLYSRSILFFNIPLLHTGLRVGYKINDMVSAQISVVNGWNGFGIETDVNEAKTFGASATINAAGVTIIPTIYVGKEFASTDTRFLGDLVASYTMDKLGLNLNFDFVKDTAAGIDPFIGIAAMGHYAVSDAVNVTLRAEYAQQKSGGTTTKAEEVTLGAAFPFSGHYEIRPEFRVDLSGDAIFNGKKNQATGTVAALAYF
jgi:Putative beta-barrel porin-2, OmpL-like. bbp2